MSARVTISFVLLCAFISASLYAQERTVRFTCIGFGEVPQGLYFQGGAGPEEVLVGGGVRGTPLSFTGPMPLSFFILEPDGAGSQRRVVQAQATIPENIADALLVFLPGSGEPGKLPWQITVMNDARGAFKAGQIRFVNLTGQPVAGVLGDEVVRLTPGQQETITPATSEEGFGIKLAAYLDEQWEPFFSSRWRYRGNIRMMILFLNDAQSGKVFMRSVPENVGANG